MKTMTDSVPSTGSPTFGLCMACAPERAALNSPGERMFTRLLQLAGEWSGTYEWTGSRTGSGTLTTAYYVTGHESAVVENLIMDGTPTMTSVYHLDHGDLRVTHFCGAANQPRLKAGHIDESIGMARFDFIDVTNAREGKGYVTGIGLHILDERHLTIKFTFGGAGDISTEHIRLERVG